MVIYAFPLLLYIYIYIYIYPPEVPPSTDISDFGVTSVSDAIFTTIQLTNLRLNNDTPIVTHTGDGFRPGKVLSVIVGTHISDDRVRR